MVPRYLEVVYNIVIFTVTYRLIILRVLLTVEVEVEVEGDLPTSPIIPGTIWFGLPN